MFTLTKSRLLRDVRKRGFNLPPYQQAVRELVKASAELRPLDVAETYFRGFESQIRFISRIPCSVVSLKC